MSVNGCHLNYSEKGMGVSMGQNKRLFVSIHNGCNVSALFYIGKTLYGHNVNVIVTKPNFLSGTLTSIRFTGRNSRQLN